MTVQQLEQHHRRYADLSNRFRSAWAFHQYLGSLTKVFPQIARPTPSDLPRIHTELKAVYRRLTGDAAGATSELDAIEKRLDQRLRTLVEEDNRVAPSLLRQFFYRVRNQDDQILRELVKFYAYAHAGGPWPEDRLDKVDLLLTKLVEEREADGPYNLGHPGRVRELLAGLWTLLGAGEGAEDAEPGETAAVHERLAELRAELEGVETLDELAEQRVVARFRSLKHGLGGRYFQPDLTLALLETNLAFKNLIHRLARLEERRIAAEYQRLFDLEQEAAVDRALAEDLETFRGEVERFERRLRHEDMKIDDLTRLRSRVRTLTARLTRDATGTVPADRARPAAAQAPPDELAEPLERIRDALDASDLSRPTRRVAAQPEIFDLRLEPREVLAYRRLAEGALSGAGADLERLILEAAALRLRINQDVEAIKGLLDESAATGEAAVFDRGRRAVQLGNHYLGRLAAVADQALVEGNLRDAQALTILRMRLVRDHAGLWLLAQKPLLRGSVED